MNFSKALEMLKNGEKISRENWNGKNQHLELQVPDENSKMTLSYIFIQTVQGDLVPWVASQTDLLAEDWGWGQLEEEEAKEEQADEDQSE